MKKTTGILLTLVLLAVLCAAAAETAGAYGTAITWTLDGEGLLRVEGSGELEDGAFWKDIAQAEDIRRVEIREGVTRIGEDAFAGCTELTEVILPESLTALGGGAFDGCDKLAEIKLPDHIREVGGLTFSETTKLVLSGLHTETGDTLGGWSFPFCLEGDNTKYICAYTEDGIRLGLAMFEPEDPDAETVAFPEGLECIQPDFFKQMTHVKQARIPDSMTDLTIASFGGAYRDFVILCNKGSAAEKFAREQGLQFDNGEEQVIGWQITDPEEKVRWVVQNYIRPEMTEREKALVLHNWIINNASYDEKKDIYESDRILVDGKGVCEAYAFAYYRLLKEAGMAACTMSGDMIPASSAGHEWNMVRIDGTWYHVDCTWDDPGTYSMDAPCISGQEKTDYFLLTDSEMGKDHQWASTYSADKGRMFRWYDPETGEEVRQQDWDRTAHYLVNWKNMTATVIDLIDEENQYTLVIPEVFESGADEFRVIAVDEGTCRGNTVLRTVTIGPAVESIGADAFRDCPNLKDITIKTELLTADTVGENVFTGIHGDAVIRCPESKVEEYRILLKEKGVEAEVDRLLKTAEDE